MTLINKLIAQTVRAAEEGRTLDYLEVPENHVGSVAEHIRQVSFYARNHLTAMECVAILRAGDVKLRGVPLRVVPKKER